MKASDFVKHIYATKKKKVRSTLDLVYDTVDKQLHKGHESQDWPWIEEFLLTLEPSLLNDSVSVGVLIITLAVKDKLKNRKVFVENFKKHLESTDKENLEATISGLD